MLPDEGGLTYPEHPFDPELCDVIAKFPPGLTDLALSGELSHQVVKLVAHVNDWKREVGAALKEHDVYHLHDLSAHSRNVTLCGEFLHRPGLSLVEQLLVLALTAYCYSTDTTRAMFWLTNAYLQLRCRHLNSVAHLDVTEKNEDLTTWIGTTLAATFDPGSQPWVLGLAMLKTRPTVRDWQANVRVCEAAYYWNDALSLRLSSKIGSLRARDRQGQG
jgi:hypothetical protein